MILIKKYWHFTSYIINFADYFIINDTNIIYDSNEIDKIISSNWNHIEVFIDSSIEKCEKRDVKGLYQLARQGIIKKFTGISNSFEKPENAEIVLNGTDSVEESVN